MFPLYRETEGKEADLDGLGFSGLSGKCVLHTTSTVLDGKAAKAHFS
jgi:hypothetical protein